MSLRFIFAALVASLAGPCPWETLLLFLNSLQYSGFILRVTALPLLIKIIIRLTYTRLMSHILFPWILWECCDFSPSFGTELCRWVAICRIAPSYLRKQLLLNVSTPSLKWIISPASFSGEHGKSLIVLNWFVSVAFKVSFKRKQSLPADFKYSYLFWVLSCSFPLNSDSCNAAAELCRCFLAYLLHKGWANGSSLQHYFSKQGNKNIQLLVLCIWPDLQWKCRGWVHKVCRPCGTKFGHRGNSV